MGVPLFLFSQGITRQTYHDKEGKYLKESYQVRDTVSQVLEGRYMSYYLNGKPESKGQFANDATTGVWEFYYETGHLKMRGLLKENASHGVWEYFYEHGGKSMEGLINGRHREGLWRTYYENGQLKEVGAYDKDLRVGPWTTFYEDGARMGEVTYENDSGHYKQYYHSGKLMGEGLRTGLRKSGRWRYYAEAGYLESEGEYVNGERNGTWKYYHPNGALAAEGGYQGDAADGAWNYYFSDGTISAAGTFQKGQKSGYWKSLSADGSLKSEITYVKGTGLYQEYYPDGRLKVKGRVENELREGPWEFFAEDGSLEGTCAYEQDKGLYKGYYPGGALQTQGEMEGDKKVGTWEIYEADGKLSGYYRPFYDQQNPIDREILEAGGGNHEKVLTRGRHFPYFDSRVNEFNAVIVGTNPVFMAAGWLPLGLEFYQQGRLGHEFEFVGLRDPFFRSDQNISPGEKFIRGYSVAIKQKFYNPLRVGLWYFGHELRFTNLGHFTNITLPQFPDNLFTASAVEQRIEYGPLLGYRLMHQSRPSGLTLDLFLSVNFGYRGFDVDPIFQDSFSDIEPSGFSQSVHFGLNLGSIFSYR